MELVTHRSPGARLAALCTTGRSLTDGGGLKALSSGVSCPWRSGCRTWPQARNCSGANGCAQRVEHLRRMGCKARPQARPCAFPACCSQPRAIHRRVDHPSWTGCKPGHSVCNRVSCLQGRGPGPCLRGPNNSERSFCGTAAPWLRSLLPGDRKSKL